MNFILLLSTTSFVLCCRASPTTYPTPESNEGEEKSWNKLSNLYTYYRAVEKLQKYENLMSQYRGYLINSIYENNDVCMLYEYLTDKDSDFWDDGTSHPNRVRRSLEVIERDETNNRHPSAVDTFFEIAGLVRDKLFYLKLLDKLEETCGDPRDSLLKRDGGGGSKVVIGKKVKFHSWGGKRSDTPKSLTNDPVVSGMRRSPSPPFHSWGGK